LEYASIHVVKDGLLFSRLLRQNSSSYLLEDIYRNPGPLQFEGPGADSKPISLCVEDQDYMGRIKKLQEYLEKVVCMNHQDFSSVPSKTAPSFVPELLPYDV
jgi:hypothetical protein